MNTIRTLHWPLILGLGALALIRPLVRIIGSQTDLDTLPIVPIALTVVITIVWIAVVGLSKIAEPVLTLVFAGLTYGILAIIVSGIVPPAPRRSAARPARQPDRDRSQPGDQRHLGSSRWRCGSARPAWPGCPTARCDASPT